MRNRTFLLIFSCFFIGMNIFSQQHLSFPVAKFKTGNDASWKERNFDDGDWNEIKTSTWWEGQGYSNYDGFAWYRIHFFLSSSLLEKYYLKDKLSFNLPSIDDADETYLNGKLIGKTGSFPNDSEGYVTKFNVQRNYTIPANDPVVAWDKDNVLAIKVYDGQGSGGMYGGNVPTMQLFDLIDGLIISYIEDSEYREDKFNISLKNTTKVVQKGKLQIQVEDTYEGKIIKSISENIQIKPSNELNKYVLCQGNKRIKIDITYTDEKTGKFKKSEIISSYILTPPVSVQPKINGSKVYGTHPGNPFLYTISATGLRPMKFDAENLPEGLTLDNKTGIISGKVTKSGDFKVILKAENSKGVASRELLIKSGDQIALTPPMGWNSWNCWGLSVDERKVLQSAHAFKEKGLMDYGWSYINIDGGWQGGRDKEGKIVPNEKFPNMKALGDSIHKMGLKFGMYSSPGPRDCAGYTGSYQHEEQDAKSFADWGVDYLKYDWCTYSEVFDSEKDYSTSAYMKPYLLMQKYLNKQNRDIVYSLCQYGFDDVWKWGAAVGNSWRTTWDIYDSWQSLSEIGFNQFALYPYAKPGHWNDPDMLIVGKIGWGKNLHQTSLTSDEQYTHISLWSLLASPLLIGCDINQLDAFTLNLLTNAEVIDVNQDPLGKQAQRVIVDGDIQVWVKELEDGSKAIGIFNLGEKEKRYDLIYSSLGFTAVKKVRDIWRQKDLSKDLSNIGTSLQVYLPKHGVGLYKLK